MAIEPPAGDEGITDKPPHPKPRTDSDSADSMPRIRRDSESSGTSTAVIAIVIVAGVVALGLCVCAPVVLFLGVIPMRMHAVHDQRAVAELQAADMAQEEVVQLKLAGFGRGAADARDAIVRNQLLLKEYPPLPAPGWHGEYIKLLKEKCNCDYQVIGEPNLAKDRQDEIKGWNEIMQAELRRRHGDTILADLNKEAEQRWRDRTKAKGKK